MKEPSGEAASFVERQHRIAEEHGYEIVDHSLILYVKPIKS